MDASIFPSSTAAYRARKLEPPPDAKTARRFLADSQTNPTPSSPDVVGGTQVAVRRDLLPSGLTGTAAGTGLATEVRGGAGITTTIVSWSVSAALFTCVPSSIDIDSNNPNEDYLTSPAQLGEFDKDLSAAKI